MGALTEIHKRSKCRETETVDCLLPHGTSVTQSLYPWLREHCRRGRHCIQKHSAMWLPVQDHTSQYSCVDQGKAHMALPLVEESQPVTAAEGGRVGFPSEQAHGGYPSPSVQPISKYIQTALIGLSRFYRQYKTIIITEEEDMNLRGMGGVESGEGWVDMMKIHCMNVF